MSMPIRPARQAPDDGRNFHGFRPEEFEPYPDNDGRSDPAECSHPIYLDFHFPDTGLCLECGNEIMLGTWQLATPEMVTAQGYQPEGRALNDTELLLMRWRWHGIWGLDGWTVTGPNLDDAVAPDRLPIHGLPTAIPPAGETVTA